MVRFFVWLQHDEGWKTVLALVAKLKQKKKEDTAEAILNGMIFLGAFGIIIPVITITFQLIVKH
jgi:hypothetical protein